MQPKKIFLICPVRGRTDEYRDLADQTVIYAEKQGYKVHYPPRDTNQDDPVGYQICEDNLEAMEAADEVWIIWDGNSQGCLFDAGMAFALCKPLVAIKLPPLTNHKSFQNMIDHVCVKRIHIDSLIGGGRLG